MTHFAVFGRPQSLQDDPEALRARFYELSKQLHPDRFSQSSAQEKTYATRWATAVNRAYQVLKDPKARALYLLELNGRDPNRGQTGVPIDLAETYFDLQDALTEPDGESRLQGFKNDLKQVQGELGGEFAELAREWDTLAGDEGARKHLLDRLTAHLARGRYLESMLADIERKQEGGGGDRRH